MTDRDNPLAMKIAKLILENDPKMLAMSTTASAEAAHALAINLGGMLSVCLRNDGEKRYREALDLIMGVIDVQARGTVARAEEMARNPETHRRH